MAVAMGMAVLVAGVVAVGLASGGLQRPPIGVVGAPRPPATTPSAIAVAPPPPLFDGDLRTLLLPKPANARFVAGRPSSGGVVSIEQVVEGFAAGPEMAADLRSLGFRRGATATWLDSKGYGVFVDLYQFDGESHALDFLLSTQGGYDEADELQSTAYVDNIVRGRWFVDKKLPGMKQQMSGLFHRGAIWAQIVVYCPTKPDVKILLKLIQDQYGRLPPA